VPSPTTTIPPPPISSTLFHPHATFTLPTTRQAEVEVSEAHAKMRGRAQELGQRRQRLLQLPTPTRMSTTTAAAANANENDDVNHHRQQTSLSRVMTSKRDGGRTRWARSAFYFYFLLSTAYRRRGIPSISTPGRRPPRSLPFRRQDPPSPSTTHKPEHYPSHSRFE
jgi:hypothetical protein